MKIFIVLALVCAASAQYGSAPAPVVKAMASMATYGSYGTTELKKPIIPIVRLDVNNDNAGSYSVDSVSGDGSKQSESASLKDLGDKEGPVSVSKGSYSFLGDDGKTYSVNWTADEQGFRAEGEHLPTSPPIPEEIKKSLLDNKYEESSYAAPAPAIRSQSYSAPAPLPVVRSQY